MAQFLRHLDTALSSRIAEVQIIVHTPSELELPVNTDLCLLLVQLRGLERLQSILLRWDRPCEHKAEGDEIITALTASQRTKSQCRDEDMVHGLMSTLWCFRHIKLC